MHVETEERVESLAAAKLLAKVVDEEQPGLVILGKQAIVTTDLRLNEPRYAKLPEIMEANKAA